MNAAQRLCLATGAQGGACRADSPRCDAMLECSSASTCRASVAMGGACDLSGGSTFCATGTSCSPNAMGTAGTCAANGTAAGSACRDAAPRCDAMFECSTPTGAGTCARPIAAGMPCVTTSTTDRCAMGGVCEATMRGGTAGACRAVMSETEPNNTPATGNGPITASTFFRGSIMPATDVDCVRVTVPMNGSITAYTGDVTGACNLGTGADTIITLYNPMGTEISTNDDYAGRGLCSEINPETPGDMRLPAGTYSVCVSTYMGTPAIASYYLNVRINPPAP